MLPLGLFNMSKMIEKDERELPFRADTVRNKTTI